MDQSTTDQVIRMAWADRVTFEEIERRVGLSEAEVIAVMRQNLKERSFKLWRKRVSGRVTKHRKLMERRKVGRRQNERLRDLD